MKVYASSVNFMLFHNFEVKSENLCFFYILCRMPGPIQVLVTTLLWSLESAGFFAN